MLVSYMILLVMMSVGVSYFVLLERKILSGIHLREGPEKSGFLGLLQPLCDGGKLFSKGINIPMKANYLIFLISPLLGLLLCFFSWILYVAQFDLMDLVVSFLIFLCLSSINAYVMILGGWSSNSIYGMLGSYRGVAQSISYEVTSALLMLGMSVMVESFNFKSFLLEGSMMWVYFLSMIIWFSVMLAESNRSPYDFVEGESELVSGFNVEFSSIGFSLLFLGEYGMMMFMSYLGGLIFWGDKSGVMMILLVVGFIWIRGVLPRFRYDKLMMMVWKFYLFYSLCYLIFIMGMMNLVCFVLLYNFKF